MAEKPNVLFIITHDIGRRFGCYGNQQIHTPHIDELARNSVVFDQHFCQWPLCGPARVNLFTGCRPLTTQRFDNVPFFPGFRERMGPAFASLPEHFRNHGYETAAAGFVYHDVDDPKSWSQGHWRPVNHHPGLTLAKKLYGERIGFPERLCGDCMSAEALALVRERWERHLAGGFTEKDLDQPVIGRRVRGPAVEVTDVPEEIYDAVQVADRAAYLIEHLPKDKPFFIAAGFTETHLPFRAPRRYWDAYDRAALKLPSFREPPEDTTDFAMGDSEPAQYYTTHGYEEPWRASEAESLELLHGRYAVVTFFDEMVGRILAALGASGRSDSTMVVLTTDHGFHEGEHGYWGKHNVWDRSLQVPLIIRPAGARRPSVRVAGLTEAVDVYPTLSELAGLPQPEGFLEGVSAAPLCDGSSAGLKKAVFAHRKHIWHDRIQAYDRADTVRTTQHRLTRYLNPSGQTIHAELFDYKKDPEERRNWFKDPTYADTVRELDQLLEQGWPAAHPDAKRHKHSQTTEAPKTSP